MADGEGTSERFGSMAHVPAMKPGIWTALSVIGSPVSIDH
jgi:hypothetical protein